MGAFHQVAGQHDWPPIGEGHETIGKGNSNPGGGGGQTFSELFLGRARPGLAHPWSVRRAPAPLAGAAPLRFVIWTCTILPVYKPKGRRQWAFPEADQARLSRRIMMSIDPQEYSQPERAPAGGRASLPAIFLIIVGVLNLLGAFGAFGFSYVYSRVPPAEVEKMMEA